MSSGVLFVHTNFPGQFRDLAQTLVAAGVPCAAIGSQTAPGVPGVVIGRYVLPRGSTPGIFPFATRAEADFIRGRAALDMARQLKAGGFDPEVIVGHTGWGETVFLKDTFPDARQICFSEFFYHGRGLDIDFDPDIEPPTDDAILLGTSKNAVMALSLTDADAIVSPTPFQASVLPTIFQPLVRRIHEGIDVETIRPGPAAPFALPDGRLIAPGTPVITYANNNMEPLRGLHIVARALPRLLVEVPEAHVLIFGNSTGRPYGARPPDGRTWQEVFFDGLMIDPQRVHFLGKTEHDQLLAAMRLSTAHIYYSYPFVLSWSLVEAMASECYVIASDTPPLRDAIEDGVNGRLLPFFDVEVLAQALIDACRNPEAAADLRRAARATAVEQFSHLKGRAAWIALLREMGLTLPPALNT
jgi:glycosyltransferase involved in cell wall biosynthesis